MISGARADLTGAEVPATLPAPVRATLEDALDGAFLAGFRDVMWIAASLALLAATCGWLMIDDDRAPSDPAADAGG